MSLRICVGYAALDLPLRCHYRHEGKQLWLIIRLLFFQNIPVDAAPIQPWGCARFQTAKRQTKIINSLGKGNRRLIPHSSTGLLLPSNMNNTTQKRASSQNNRIGGNLAAISQHNTGDSALMLDQVSNLGFDNIQPIQACHHSLHRLTVKLSVRLCAWPTNGRTLPAVQQPKLYACCIRSPAHQSI